MTICVYGASRNGISAAHIAAGEELGRKMAERGHRLVFGGGASGMMGAAARGMHRGGGYIIGVAPTFFNVDGVLYPECNEMIGTETMRERKRTLEDSSDAFIVTPGGIGTYDEFFEVLTLKHLNRHAKPIAVFNNNGYFDPLLKMIEQNVAEGFINPGVCSLYFVGNTADEVLDYIESAVAER